MRRVLLFVIARADPTSISRLLGQKGIGVVDCLAIEISSPQAAPRFLSWLSSFF
jgi:hypothetical protein